MSANNPPPSTAAAASAALSIRTRQRSKHPADIERTTPSLFIISHTNITNDDNNNSDEASLSSAVDSTVRPSASSYYRSGFSIRCWDSRDLMRTNTIRMNSVYYSSHHVRWRPKEQQHDKNNTTINLVMFVELHQRAAMAREEDKRRLVNNIWHDNWIQRLCNNFVLPIKHIARGKAGKGGLQNILRFEERLIRPRVQTTK